MNEESREIELETAESAVPDVGDVKIVVNGNVRTINITVNHFDREDDAE